MTTEANFIEPGPFAASANAGIEAPAAAAPVTEAPAAAAPAAQPIFRGIQRDITDPAELSKYALELEKRTIEQEARLSGMGGAPSQTAPAAAPALEAPNYGKLAEKFILDPAGAIQEIETRIRSSIMGDVSQQTGRTEFYRSFYDENEDLAGAQDLVELSVAKNGAKWKNVPIDQAKKLLADDVRSRLAQLRGTTIAGTGTPLSTAPAHALPTSSGSAPKTPAAASAPTTFLAEFSALRAKRKKLA